MFQGRKVGFSLKDFMRREVHFVGPKFGRGIRRQPVIWDDELKETAGAQDGYPVRITAKNCPSRR